MSIAASSTTPALPAGATRAAGGALELAGNPVLGPLSGAGVEPPARERGGLAGCLTGRLAPATALLMMPAGRERIRLAARPRSWCDLACWQARARPRSWSDLACWRAVARPRGRTDPACWRAVTWSEPGPPPEPAACWLVPSRAAMPCGLCWEAKRASRLALAVGAGVLALVRGWLGTTVERWPSVRGAVGGVSCGRLGPGGAGAHAAGATHRFLPRERCRPVPAVGAGIPPQGWGWLGATGKRCAGVVDTPGGMTCSGLGPGMAGAHVVGASCRFCPHEPCWEATRACRPAPAEGAGTPPQGWGWLGATGEPCAGVEAIPEGVTCGRLGPGRAGASGAGCDPAEQE